MHDGLVLTNVDTKNQLDWTLFTTFRKKIWKIGLYKGPKLILGYGIGIFSKFFFSKCSESKIRNFDEDRFWKSFLVFFFIEKKRNFQFLLFKYFLEVIDFFDFFCIFMMILIIFNTYFKKNLEFSSISLKYKIPFFLP